MPSEHRLHPSSILFALAGSLKAFLLPLVLVLVTSGRSSPPSSDPTTWGPAGWMNGWMPGDVTMTNWQFWSLFFLILATIAAILRYVSFRLRYEGTELVITSGIIFRNERHVPYARIHNLDAVRNVAHRLFGVATVCVETGGGSAPEATISVLHDTIVEEMRRRVFEGRANAVPDDPAPSTTSVAIAAPEPRPLLYLPIRELLLSGLLDNRGMLVVAAACGVLWEAGLLRDVWDRLASGWYAPGLLSDTAITLAKGGLPSPGRIAILLFGIGGLLLLVRVLSMAWSVLRLYEFRLTRVGEDLRTEYGLLTRVSTTIPLKRVQSLTVREAPLQRLAGRMSVRVETAGGRGLPQGGPKQPTGRLAPIIHRSAMPGLVRDVFPGFTFDGLEWQPLHARAVRRALKPVALLAILATAPFVIWFGWAGLLVLPLTAPWPSLAVWTHVRHTRWASTADSLVFRSGWLWRELTVVPVAKIQVVRRVESPFDRRAAMAGIRVDTAGSASPAHRISIPYLAPDVASALYERLTSQAAQTAFRW
jgi:putative membrane protein